jgi:hypothetical protein
MKKIACIVAGLFVALTMAAQTKVTWSMELGLGMSTWMGKDAGDSSPLFNQKVGVGIDVPLSGLVSFQTGLYWASKGASIDEYFEWDNTQSVVNKHVNQNYFEMPLLAAFHVGTAANFDMVFTAGPYLAYGVNGKCSTDIEDLTVSYSTFGDSKIKGEINPGLHRFDAGVMVGVALDFERWTVGLDGEFGCCKLASNSKTRNLAFFFTAGYKF